MMCVVYEVLQRGHSGDGYDLASTLCMYDLRKRDLFVLSWCILHDLEFVNAGRGDHIKEAYYRAGLMTAL